MDAIHYDARVGEALKLAADAFASRTRKGSGVPYLTHLLAVTTLVLEHGGDSEQAAAAALHDYLEDIPGARVEELERQFGPRVTRIVVALSDATDAENKAPWRERKESYLAHLRGAPADVKLVSSADKLHNATSILADYASVGALVFDRFTASREQTLWYYRQVHEALATDWNHPLLTRLEAAVDTLHALDP